MRNYKNSGRMATLVCPSAMIQVLRFTVGTPEFITLPGRKFNELSSKRDLEVGMFAERDALFSHRRYALKITAVFESLF